MVNEIFFLENIYYIFKIFFNLIKISINFIGNILNKLKVKVLILNFSIYAHATLKEELIQNLKNINNMSFDFEQNINEKNEKGNCVVQYPKKIYCYYDNINKKIMVSNGKSLVIKTSTSYYIYPIEKTSLNLILNKEFLIKKIASTKGRLIDNKFINFIFFQNDNEINVFFDKKTYNLIGWQTLDIYQNLSITYLFSIVKNQKLNKNLFKLPKQN